MPGNASGQQRETSKESLLDRAIDIFKPQPGPPPKPPTPPVNQKEWHQSVEQKQVVPGLTLHDVGLSVFGETRSLRNRAGSNEPIGTARQRVAHAIINDAELSHQPASRATRFIRPWSPREKRCATPRSTPLTSPRYAPRAKHISAVMTQPAARRTLTCVRGLIVPTGNSQMEQPKVSRSARSPGLTTIFFRIGTRRHTLLG